MRNFSYEEGVSYYLKLISQIPLLTPEEEKEVTRKVREGDEEALKKLIQSNLRFVVNVAKRYAGYEVPFQELISAGNVGLIEAAKRFDPDKGVKFIVKIKAMSISACARLEYNLIYFKETHPTNIRNIFASNTLKFNNIKILRVGYIDNKCLRDQKKSFQTNPPPPLPNFP